MAKNSEPSITFQDAIDRVLEGNEYIKQVQGFKFPEAVLSQIREGSDIYTSGGSPQEAIAKIISAVTGLYRILAAFIRNSPGKYFQPRIDGIVNAYYAQHIVELVQSRKKQLEDAIRLETGNSGPQDFERRVAAYAELSRVKEREARKKEEEAKAAAQRERSLQQRAEEVARRQQEAERLHVIYT